MSAGDKTSRKLIDRARCHLQEPDIACKRLVLPRDQVTACGAKRRGVPVPPLSEILPSPSNSASRAATVIAISQEPTGGHAVIRLARRRHVAISVCMCRLVGGGRLHTNTRARIVGDTTSHASWKRAAWDRSSDGQPRQPGSVPAYYLMPSMEMQVGRPPISLCLNSTGCEAPARVASPVATASVPASANPRPPPVFP